MFDLLGKQVMETLETSQLKIKHLPTGMYLIKVVTDYNLYTTTIMKKK